MRSGEGRAVRIQHLLLNLLGLALVTACSSQEVCANSGAGGEQSASLLQSSATKVKVAFQGEEEEEPSAGGGDPATKDEAFPSEPSNEGTPQLGVAQEARAIANGTRSVAELWGHVSEAALQFRGVVTRNSTTLSTVPIVMVCLGVVLCMVALGTGFIGYNPFKEKDPGSSPLNQPGQPHWKQTPLQMPHPPSMRRPAAEAGTRPAPTSSSSGPFAEGISRRFSLPPEPTPAQSMLSVGRGSPLGSQVEPQQLGSFLCPGLVVPEECECSLLVPRLDPQAASGEVTVDDAARVPVFRVVYSIPSRSDRGAQRQDQEGNRCLVLSSSADDNTVFAFCRLGLNGALTILDAAEKPFGLIRARVGKSGFEVATRLGSQINLSVTDTNEIAATDRRGRTLALTESVPGNSLRRMVRIGPFVDAGLITLAVLAVDLLEIDSGGYHRGNSLN